MLSPLWGQLRWGRQAAEPGRAWDRRMPTGFSPQTLLCPDPASPQPGSCCTHTSEDLHQNPLGLAPNTLPTGLDCSGPDNRPKTSPHLPVSSSVEASHRGWWGSWWGNTES